MLAALLRLSWRGRLGWVAWSVAVNGSSSDHCVWHVDRQAVQRVLQHVDTSVSRDFPISGRSTRNTMFIPSLMAPLRFFSPFSVRLLFFSNRLFPFNAVRKCRWLIFRGDISYLIRQSSKTTFSACEHRRTAG